MESIQDQKQKKKLINDLNPEQLQILAEFRKIIEQKEILVGKSDILKMKYTEDNQLIRILIARNFKLKESTIMWEKFVQWRFENKADEIDPKDILNELQVGKAFLYGYDKKNNPILIVKTKKHFPNQIHIDETKRYFLFLMEVAGYLSEKSGTERLSVIWDREGFSQLKNFDTSVFSLFKSIVGIMHDNYSERMDKCFILHPNFFSKMIHGIISPFLTQRTREKIVVINKLEDLKMYIDVDQLLVEHGGNAKFEYSYPPDYLKTYEKEINLASKEQNYYNEQELIKTNNEHIEEQKIQSNDFAQQQQLDQDQQKLSENNQ